MSPNDAALSQTIRRVERSTAHLARQDAEDAVQEALARALKHGVDPLAEAWLRTVAKRVAVDGYRRRREYASGDASDLERYEPSFHSDPEESALAAERACAIREALDALPPRYREALMVYAEVDGRAGEVGRRLDTSPSATWTLLCRARSRMRAELKRLGYAPALVWARINRWQDSLGFGGAAVGAAVIVALSTPDPVPATQQDVPAPVMVEAAAVAPLTTTEPGSASPPARVVDSSTNLVPDESDTAAVEAEERVRYGADACVPGEDEGQSPRVGGGVWFVDDENSSVSETVVEAVPEELRQGRAGGCE